MLAYQIAGQTKLAADQSAVEDTAAYNAYQFCLMTRWPETDGGLWSIALSLAVLEQLRDLALNRPVLFIMLGPDDSVDSAVDFLVPFTGLDYLVWLELDRRPDYPLIRTGSGRLLCQRQRVEELRQAFRGQHLDWRENPFDIFFMQAGLLAGDELGTALLAEGIPALFLAAAPEPGLKPGQTARLEEPALVETKLVAAIVGLATTAAPALTSDANYLSYDFFGRVLIIAETSLVRWNLLGMALCLAILFFRLLLYWPLQNLFASLPSPGASAGPALQEPTVTRPSLSLAARIQSLPVVEALWVVILFFLTFMAGRFIANNLSALLELIFSTAAARSGRVVFYARLVYYVLLFFLFYGLLEAFRFMPPVRRSNALQAAAMLFFVNSVIATAVLFQYSLLFIVPAVLILTVGNTRPLSWIGFLLALLPIAMLVQAMLSSYYDTVLELVLAPSPVNALLLAFVMAPLALWFGSLFSRRERLQRGARSLLLLAALSVLALALELVYSLVAGRAMV
ncbi:MAG: hypothetical protein A2087_05635 [Spirochaetes bacterium GWD1_61_31]|nr:MAG: hypothetical protein A2Y37_03555 [Spirochaetes bacterium GWB1_60_80]OHD35117.1 MAG: hypothetical protein A2004_05380 [Spirochaetes bacterium GWC1_61_12]OHD43636.1 MAG: hypothetical protein A2087_05635 [Spirochaetes bacterium GWD1_61_31]OHD44128.1 MAG: hypothetical protein A2Y35_02060 [Spirochaetes bacterium GWE1_60_18]OHD61831.1 MAG: hypothetical protein A2Y32_13815 [Spirochaetes bacterium GWF1_60_12]